MAFDSCTRREEGELEMLTFTHIFKSCSQYSYAVLAVVADVFQQLKIALPGLKTVCYGQDNAGCYKVRYEDLSAGNDIETPEQRKAEVLSSGGVPGVNIALCETVSKSRRCYLQR